MSWTSGCTIAITVTSVAASTGLDPVRYTGLIPIRGAGAGIVLAFRTTATSEISLTIYCCASGIFADRSGRRCGDRPSVRTLNVACPYDICSCHSARPTFNRHICCRSAPDYQYYCRGQKGAGKCHRTTSHGSMDGIHPVPPLAMSSAAARVDEVSHTSNS